ncbi:MAG TPA: MG2 domain-containing protein [Spirochaetales bacterium]|nr:MG2 domain-containing protein [Spirochaetales bacterium]
MSLNRTLRFKAAIAAVVFVSALSAACSRGRDVAEDRAPDPAFVVAHSDGIVSRFADLSVVLSSGRDAGALRGVNPLSFDPPIDGAVSWSDDGSRLDFRPASPLKPGETYRAVFDFAAIGEPSNGWFSFKVRAAEPGLSVTPGALYAAFDGSLSLDGSLRSDDAPAVADVERLVSATVDGRRLDLSWSHEGDGLHRFTVKRIPRSERESALTLSWDGKPIGASAKGSERYRVPAEGSFELLSVTGPEPGEPACLRLAFSEPVDKAQDFRGLIRASSPGTSPSGALRYESEGGLVRVYSSLGWSEEVGVTVEKGLRGLTGGAIAVPVQATVRFDWEMPEVRFQAGGVIVPSTQGTRVVMETRNLSKVVVEALRVYGDNMLQFLQVNDLDGSKELKRVGEVVWREEIDLGWTDDKKNQWTPYALDLSPLLAKHPDGLFQLRVAFGRDHIRYVSPNDHASLGKWTFPPVTIRDKGDDSSYWDYYESWFDWDEYYRYRDDPTHPAFYVQRYGRDRTARRNVLVSDVALSAKLDVDGAWHLVAGDLRTAKPLSGARVSLYSYAMRELASASADASGLAVLKPRAGETAEPYFAVAEAAGAKSGRERGYLKLTPSSALAVSHFDVGGETAESGVKGFIYGERGVWRPGDDMHLCFVLYDRLGTLPADHPVRFELESPLGQVTRQATYTESVGGFYYIRTGTDPSAPTGTWTARVTVGGKTFSKAVKVETVMPNRLKLELDYGGSPYVGADLGEMGLRAAWLHGAPAPGLKADVSMTLSASAKAPGDYPGFSFQDPLRTAPSSRELLFDGYLDGSGAARFRVDLAPEGQAPGPLTATFLSRAFERSGLFSSEQFSVDFHPYRRYVGVKVPEGDASRGMLLTDRDHPVEILLVDRDGKPSGDGRVEVSLYKLEWRWWWEKGSESLAEQASDIYSRRISKDVVDVRNGRASWKLRVNYPEWGRYMLRVADLSGAATAGGAAATGAATAGGNHAAGKVFYIDWPGWAGRGKGEGGGSASMLTMSADKERYDVGQTVSVSFPSNKEGRAFVTIERSGRVLREEWVEAKDGNTVYSFKATADMAPNVYVHASFVQPHLQTLNDLPIRLYGVVPVMVEDPATRLQPVIAAPDSLEPMKKAVVTVSERSGKPMTYTLAAVEEGLLGITRYVAPNPWNEFYKKEASQLRSFDLYKDVAGAYSGKLQTLISIGGSEFGDAGGTRKISRFPPVVKYFGPFQLGRGAKASHELELGPYVGSVRLMVVAGTPDGAYGKAELETPVRSELMAYLTAPRVLGPGETASLPVTLLGFMGRGAEATVSIKLEGDAAVVGESKKTLRFAEEGEQSTSFDIAVTDRVGAVSILVEAAGPGGRVSAQRVDVPVRSASVPVTTVSSALVAGKASAVVTAPLPGMPGSNEAWLELSLVPPIDLSGRLAYLIGYPHGCGEQTVSKAFPQLFLGDAVALSPEQAEEARSNVAAAVTKMAGFQTSSGGFVFWQGSYDESAWLTAYVTHFLVMARKQGYSVPEAMLGSAVARLGEQASGWNAQADFSKAEQSYRLYVLALAGKPDVASMNRFMEYGPHRAAALYQVAAAYALAGMRDRARSILREAPADVEYYEGMRRVYGSVLRDRAIVLDAFNALGDQARGLPLFKRIAEDLSSGTGYSTQDLSYALIASLPYMKSASSGTATLRYAYDGVTGSAAITKAITRVPLVAGADALTVRLENASAAAVYARVAVTGTPKPGSEPYRSEGLQLSARYLDASEQSVDPARLPFGSDMIVELAVRNTSGDELSDVALTFRAASGWEIANLRVGRTDDDGSSGSSYDYQDTRDDRVMTYLGLKRGETKRYRFYVNKAYEGEFFLPAFTAEAMYDPTVYAVLPGRPLPKPSAEPRANPNSRGQRP